MFSCLLVTESSTVFPHAPSYSLKIEIIRLVNPYISTSEPKTHLYMLRIFLSAQQLKRKSCSCLYLPLNSVSIPCPKGFSLQGFPSLLDLINLYDITLIGRQILSQNLPSSKKKIILGPYGISQLTDYFSTLVCFLRVLYNAVFISSTFINFESNIGASCPIVLFNLLLSATSELHAFWPFFYISFAGYFHSTKPLRLGASPTSKPTSLLSLCLSLRGLHQFLYFLN